MFSPAFFPVFSLLFSPWFIAPDQIHSSYLLLAILGGLGLAVGLLYRIGVIDWAFWGLGLSVRGCIRGGFQLWELLLAWASWPVFLALVAPIMRQLVADTNSRIRLIAASFVLSAELDNEPAGIVMAEALGDPAPRVRKAALELVESLGQAGAGFLEALRGRANVEDESDLRDIAERLVGRLQGQGGTVPPPVAVL